jgi:hypothetical protein
LLLEFEILAGEAQWFSTGVQAVGSNADFRTSMARLALRPLRSMSLRKRMADRAKAALSVVKSFSISGPGGVRFQLDVDAAPGFSGKPRDMLSVAVLRDAQTLVYCGGTRTYGTGPDSRSVDLP